MKIAIYTAIFGNKDTLKKPLNYQLKSNVDWFCFTDSDSLESEVYVIKKVERKYHDITKNARKIKILASFNNDEYDFIIWHDANIRLDSSQLDLLIENLADNQYLFFRHPKRICAYQEALACIDLNKDYPMRILKTVSVLLVNGLSKNMGLHETGIIVRNNEKRNSDFENYWWHLVKRFSRRDQITLPLSLKKYNLKIKTMPENITNSVFCRLEPHNYNHYYDHRQSLRINNNITKSVAYRIIKTLIKLKR